MNLKTHEPDPGNAGVGNRDDLQSRRIDIPRLFYVPASDGRIGGKKK
jgi:hypothetical protein